MTDLLEQWANQNAENTKLVAQELLITEVTEEIWKAMEEAGVNKTELANRIGATKGYVFQLLSGSRDMTLRTLSEVCFVGKRGDQRMISNKKLIDFALPLEAINAASARERSNRHGQPESHILGTSKLLFIPKLIEKAESPRLSCTAASFTG